MTDQNAVVKKELTESERFMNMVVSQFTGSVGEVALTDFQKRLAQNYFVSLDGVLKAAEDKRLFKKEKNRDPVPVTWKNVNMEKLALDVVAYARIGFDPAQKNHISMVPFKNNKTGKYDIAFIEGYRGIELKSVKYGLNIPDHIVVEVVFSTDKFHPLKKDARNPCESYEFEITNPFNRGEPAGGFYYHSYFENPEKNKLVIFSLKDILKRRPEYASVEFWGGEKDKWENGQKVGKEKVEGWYEQMCWKTIFRAAHGDITIDSQKIDDDYMRLKQIEQEHAEMEVKTEIAENANRQPIDVTPPDTPDPEEPQVPPAEKKPSAKTKAAPPGDKKVDIDDEREIDF